MCFLMMFVWALLWVLLSLHVLCLKLGGERENSSRLLLLFVDEYSMTLDAVGWITHKRPP